MRAELKHLQRELGTTTIYVTHDQIEAMTLAHRVAVMNAGIVQQIDSPREIYENPANLFVAGFMGSPPMNFIAGDIEDGHFVCAHGKVPAGRVAPRRAVTLGFRPEDSRIADAADAQLAATVYSTEMTGNETIVTCSLAKDTILVKAGKDYDAPIDAPVHVAVDAAKICLFDSQSGDRIRN
jgi:multiple sugar transport system ATP-binding protein